MNKTVIFKPLFLKVPLVALGFQYPPTLFPY
jgi:hypothetical protein